MPSAISPSRHTGTGKPGLLLVHPRLHDPTPDNAATFLRWTKLHFRDLLDAIPAASASASSDDEDDDDGSSRPDNGLDLGHVTHDLRFSAPDGDARYTHHQQQRLHQQGGEGEEEGEATLPKYLYICIVSDIRYLKSNAYASVSRKLNLEETRALQSGEEAVAYAEKGDKDKNKNKANENENEKENEAMVFDIVDAKFAVYEEVVGTGLHEKTDEEVGISFQELPTRFTSRDGAPPKSVLVAVYVDLPSATAGAGAGAGAGEGARGDDVNVPERLKSSLLTRVKTAVPTALKSYASLYRWSGVEAQPELHPLIEKDGRGEWMLLLLLVHEEGRTLVREHAVMLVQGWVDEERGKLGGGRIDFGVWEGEVFMR